MSEASTIRAKVLPFILTAAVLVLDQASKAAVLSNFAPNERAEVLGDFLRIWRRSNTAVAFSMGSWLPEDVQRVLFLALGLAVVAVVLVYYFRARDITVLQRWLLAGVAGGGLGNQIDRIIRGSVVDWVDVKFYGIFGMERWPTFNVADSTVVVVAIAFMVSVIVQESRSKGSEE